jgi:class 3 adenylate cyclase/tetratricopeptide (TPR) repeat protein
MVALPTGDVTFLLTDVVGSTALWEEAPDAMAVALPRHDALIAAAVERNRGLVLKSRGEGDSTFCVFHEPGTAAAAAVEAQRALAAEAWPARARLRVRMAMHHGEAIEREGDFYGQVVNRVARLRATAGGGEVRVSEACARALEGRLPDQVGLVRVGTQVLRDIANPETVFALRDPALRLEPAPAVVTVLRPALPTALVTNSASFAGRAAELHVIRRAADEARRGRRRVVVMSGEPGIGKTRLIMELAARAHADGWAVLYGASDEGVDLPYQPVVEALTDLVRAAPADLLAAHLGQYGGEVGRLVPALFRRVSSVPGANVVDPETERLLLFDAVTGLLRSATAITPVLLALDDVQWAERNTLGLLRHVVRLTADCPLLFLVAYRSSHLEDDHPLSSMLAALAREEGVDRVRLDGLPVESVFDLMERAAGQTLGGDGRALAHRLHQETNGNPFFTTELLRHFVESDVVSEIDGRWALRQELVDLRLPETVSDVITERVRRLGEQGRQLLTVASVIGRDFDTGLLARVTGQDEDAVLDMLEQAGRASLVTEMADRPGQFRFAHALVAHALYQRLGPSRRARIHLQVAQALADVGGKPPALASHWLAAQAIAPPHTVTAHLEAAGDWALAQLAPHEAAQWYGAALNLAEPGTAARSRLLIGLGTAQMRLGQPGYRDTLLEAAEVARAAGEPGLLVAAALANNRGDTSTAGVVDLARVSVLEEALTLVEADDLLARARLLSTLAVELVYDADWARRVALSDEGLRLARQHGDPAALAEVLNLRHEAIRLPHTLETRLAETEEQVRLAERIGDPVLLGFAAVRRARAALEAGDLAEFDRCAERADAVADLHPYLRWDAALRRSYRTLLAGDPAGAETCALEAYAIAEADDQPDGLAVLASQLVLLRWDQGRFAEIESLVREAVAANPGIPGFRAAAMLVLCELGRDDDARAMFEEDVAGDFDRFVYNPLWLASMVMMAEVCSQLRHRPAAAMLVEWLRPYHGQVATSGVSVFGLVATQLGQLSALLGDTDGALGFLAEGERIAGRMGAVPLLARNQLATGIVRGDEDQLRAVAATAAEHGLDGIATRARAALDGGPATRV